MWLGVAFVVANRSTCPRRSVGCVLTDKDNLILSSGYNGVAAGLPHCNEFPCAGVSYEKGQGLDKCEAIHAEQNALLQCRNYKQIHTCYVTVSPCIHCLKMLLNTSCQRIVYAAEYYHADARRLWVDAGREWIPYEPHANEVKSSVLTYIRRSQDAA